MPTDKRSITFSERELGEVLLAFCREKGRRVPEVGFPHPRPSLDRDSSVIVVVEVQSKVITFAEHEIAAALIMYCLWNKIPLPRSAKKSLSINDQGEVSLNLSMETQAGDEGNRLRRVQQKLETDSAITNARGRTPA